MKRFAGLTGFQSAREVAKMQQRHEAEEKNVSKRRSARTTPGQWSGTCSLVFLRSMH